MDLVVVVVLGAPEGVCLVRRARRRRDGLELLGGALHMGLELVDERTGQLVNRSDSKKPQLSARR